MSDEPISYDDLENEEFAEPPTTTLHDLALLSRAEDPEEYRDLHGAIVDKYNWDSIDQRLELRGTLADRPDPADVDIPGGAKYEVNDPGADDHGAVYLFDDSSGEWELSSRQLETVRAGELQSTSVSGITVGPEDETMVSAKSDWQWSAINWEMKGEPIITGDNAEGSAGYPTLLHGSALDNPIDDWYLYWSSHDFDGIYLSTASDPWGPWTYYGQVWADSDAQTHTASPSIVYDPLEDELKLYYHIDYATGTSNYGWVQHTRVVRGDLSDGTNFDSSTKEVVLDSPMDGSAEEEEVSYLSVVRQGSSYVGVYQGRDESNNCPIVASAHSSDGVNWTREGAVADNTIWIRDSYNPRTFQGGTGEISTLGGKLWVLYQDRNAREIRAVPYQQRDQPMFGGGETVLTEPSWVDGDGIGPGETLVADGFVYQFFFEDNVPDNDYNIGVARAPLKEVMA